MGIHVHQSLLRWFPIETRGHIKKWQTFVPISCLNPSFMGENLAIHRLLLEVSTFRCLEVDGLLVNLDPRQGVRLHASHGLCAALSARPQNVAAFGRFRSLLVVTHDQGQGAPG